MTTGYGLFSGGLDSILAARMLIEQGVKVRVVTFTTPFFGADRAIVSARSIGLEPIVEDLTDSHLQMLINPKYDYGRFMNPCIDCHALMYRRAGEIMTAQNGDFLFSGEVLGQRPKSQNRRALDLVAKESGYAAYILRPLSAKLLPPTRMELEGKVDRERLSGISGRSRKPQTALASEYGVTDYPSPAGGCLLTDTIFSRRLKELLDNDVEAGGVPAVRDIELLKYGRHFRIPGGKKIIVGRNKNENEAIESLTLPHDLTCKVANRPGPTVLIPYAAADGGIGIPEKDLARAASMTVSYSDAEDHEPVPVRVILDGNEMPIEAMGAPKSLFAGMMI